MTAYWVNTFTAIHDEERLARYVELAGPAMRAAGGEFLARGNPVHVLEGNAGLRTTVIRFADADAALAAYRSPAYQHALAVLGDAAERDIRVLAAVEG
ncbi:DUF1330 domain-containing protein [Pseudonocardia hydrocarbonoxydans]|uniref:DUF1330 domain-containing protein n=1 Tax=Pseudonocardia hydrocarbonoxydans TaxID=76726 RepID=A0A4Y3WUA4_9PSEU|nr:DUF1330 domain-containing protein [Pseudonocardia hydrocarbonoxydans]GEC22423.1 hypothetical protein PHY01_47060 [Pseudonocardia hydrocarbonoxydans]